MTRSFPRWLALFVSALPCALAEPPSLLSWNFDQPLPPSSLRGNAGYAPGVSGQALLLDGFTTTVIASRSSLPALHRGFSVEAWIAPQEYSWNWTALVNQGAGRESGFFFGIDYTGRIRMSAAFGDAWISAVSTARLPPLRCPRIDGWEEASAPASGSLSPSPAGLRIGASQELVGAANTGR